MKCFASVMLVSLLTFSAADATVYVWKDPSGVLVMTNHESEVPDEARESVITYGTTSDLGTEQVAEPAGRDVRPAVPDAPRVAVPHAAHQAAQEAAPGAAPVAAQDAAPGSAARTATASQHPGPAGMVAADMGEAQRARAPQAVAQAPPSVARATNRRTLGGTPDERPAIQGTNAPTGGAIDPRSLLTRAAQREPPKVFVSVVTASARPLSTSDRMSSASGDRASGLQGSSASGLSSSALGGALREASSSGMLGTR